MAPIVYYLNKNYTPNFGANGNVGLDRHNVAKSSGSSSTDRHGRQRVNSNKLFFWLRTIPGSILAACIVFGLLASFYNVYRNELPPSWFYTMADPDSKALYFGEHMTKLWTHLAVFAMGIIAGVECRRATMNIIRGYRGSNMVLMSHNNSFSKHHKSQSSSSSSLPVILSRSGDSMSSSKTPSDLNNSSISINIHTNNSSHENISESIGTATGTRSMDDGMLISGGGSISGHNGHHNNINNGNCGGDGGGGFCSMLVDIIGCLMAITTMSAIIFSTHDWSLNDLPDPLVAGVFDAGSRFLWSLALIWILYMVSVPDKNGNFSLLARSLGHPGMVCLGKLSFLIYIIHPFVHTAVLAIQEQPIYSSWLMMFHILLGNLTLTVILASLVSLFVEMPCRNLFRRCGTSLLLTQSAGIGRGSRRMDTRTTSTAAAPTS